MASPEAAQQPIHLTADALRDRAAYIYSQADAIRVRVMLCGTMQTLTLAQLPPATAIREAFALLLRTAIEPAELTPAPDTPESIKAKVQHALTLVPRFEALHRDDEGDRPL
jgi:hypothetical protein